jgi:hypothetical protein
MIMGANIFVVALIVVVQTAVVGIDVVGIGCTILCRRPIVGIGTK